MFLIVVFLIKACISTKKNDFLLNNSAYESCIIFYEKRARLRRGYDAETIPKTGTETARLRHGYDAETIPKTGTETARIRSGYEAETIPKTGRRKKEPIDVT